MNQKEKQVNYLPAYSVAPSMEEEMERGKESIPQLLLTRMRTGTLISKVIKNMHYCLAGNTAQYRYRYVIQVLHK